MAAYAATVSLKRILYDIMRYRDHLFDPYVINKMKSLYGELVAFQDFLQGLNSRGRKRMNASLERVAEACRTVDFSLIELLKKVKEEFLIEEEEETGATSRSKRVGLSDVWIQLKEDLLVPDIRKGVFDALSLVGMAGIGKTTLAREVFQDLDIAEWFDCRAWVTVGFEWKPEEVTKAILAQVEPVGSAGEDLEEMAMSLRVSLMDKRYLIVLDDVWNENISDYLEASLPDSKNGSQILLTTSNRHVSPFMLEVRLLGREESWHLLRDRVFGGDLCPPQLEVAGKKIAEKCDGLPLTIVTVADLLSKAEEAPISLWIDVATKKRHQLFVEAYDKISEVLYPSYMQLVGRFKPCFLYMGLFPLKSKVRGSKLINLWIVEKLTEPKTIETLELNGAMCLSYFYIQCLVIVHQWSSSLSPSLPKLGIKTFSLHSTWWHFCQRVARRTKSYYILDCFDDAFEEGIQSQGWLSIHNNVLLALKDVHHSIEENCATTATTLLCFGPYSQYMVPMCFGLKLLKRLDALNIRFYDFPLEVLELIKLRYLAMTCNGELPPSISRLPKLVYLIVHRHSTIKANGAPSYLPEEIWDMKSLRYLNVKGCDLPDIGDTSLPELTTLSDVTTHSCNVLKRLSNLKKLGIRIELTPDYVADPLCCFDHISHVSKLESFKCIVMNPEYRFEAASLPCLPISLRKLSLSGLRYSWEEMNKIASLPNLETLKIRYNAFRGPEWEVHENGFRKLHLLQIEDTDLVKLKFALGSVKCLYFLRMKHCYKLQEIHFDNHENIGEIEVVDCNPLVERSIKETIARDSEFYLWKFDVHYSWESE